MKIENLDRKRNQEKDAVSLLTASCGSLLNASYPSVLHYKATLPQWKDLAKRHCIKSSGTKSQLVERIHSHFKETHYATKIQQLFRGHCVRRFFALHGPALHQRQLCTNSMDFFTMEDMTDVSPCQFVSFRDMEGFVYGFDLLSLYNLFLRTTTEVKNPFSQKPMPLAMKRDMETILRLGRVLHIPILTEIADVMKEVSEKKSVELQTLALFQQIDALGNYSNAQWFLKLGYNSLIRFIRELRDIWEYRANLSWNMKQAICPPSGNPFSEFPNIVALQSMDELRKPILRVMEKMVISGTDKDSQSLGAYYVLGAMTLVSKEAAVAIPWLYEATAFHNQS